MRYQPRALKLIMAACLTSLWLLAGLAPAQAQEFDQYGRWINGFTEPWFIESTEYTRDEVDLAIKRWMQMGDGANGDEWAGQYGTGGETHGTYVRWSAEAGYVMLSVSKCEARVMNLDYGKVELSPGRVQFNSLRAPQKTYPAYDGHTHARPPRISEFLTVKWRGSRYLVPETELARFCDQAAGLGVYNSGMAAQLEELAYFEFLGKSYKEREQVSEELPIVPEGYERFVKNPVEASVTAVGAKRTKRLTLHDGSFSYEAVRTLALNAGSLNGIKRGMTLRVVESEEDDEVKITRVGKRSASGILVRQLDDNLNETYMNWETKEVRELPEVKVGWRLTTSPRW